jgi:hypothetical protein
VSDLAPWRPLYTGSRPTTDADSCLLINNGQLFAGTAGSQVGMVASMCHLCTVYTWCWLP